MSASAIYLLFSSLFVLFIAFYGFGYLSFENSQANRIFTTLGEEDLFVKFSSVHIQVNVLKIKSNA